MPLADIVSFKFLNKFRTPDGRSPITKKLSLAQSKMHQSTVQSDATDMRTWRCLCLLDGYKTIWTWHLLPLPWLVCLARRQARVELVPNLNIPDVSRGRNDSQDWPQIGPESAQSGPKVCPESATIHPSPAKAPRNPRKIREKQSKKINGFLMFPVLTKNLRFV